MALSAPPLTVPGLKAPVHPLEYTITEAINELFELDLLIYSDDQTLDGVHFLGKKVSFVVEERAALKYLDTASRHARTLHGVVRERGRARQRQDEGRARARRQGDQDREWQHRTGLSGDFNSKAASFSFEGPQNADMPLPKLPESDFKPTNHYPLTR